MSSNFNARLQYVNDFIASFIWKAVSVGMLMVFWGIVLTYSKSDRTLIDLLSYFLLAEGISELNNAFRTKLGTYLRKFIQDGSISGYLIKPIKVLPAVYAAMWGDRAVHNTIALIFVIAALIINPPVSILAGGLFLLYLILSFFISLAFNLVEGVLAFYLVSPGGIMNSLVHLSRILSGYLIPFTFFPGALRTVVELTPFPYMVYRVIDALSITEFSEETVRFLLIGFFWAVILNLFMLYFWKEGLKKYEAIGL